MTYFIHYVLTSMFRALLWLSSGWCYYRNTKVQMWLAVSHHSIRDGGDWLDPVPAALLQGKSPLVPLDRALGGPWSQCGPFGKKENILPLSGMKLWSLGCPVYSPVTIGIVFTLFSWNRGPCRNPQGFYKCPSYIMKWVNGIFDNF